MGCGSSAANQPVAPDNKPVQQTRRGDTTRTLKGGGGDGSLSKPALVDPRQDDFYTGSLKPNQAYFSGFVEGEHFECVRHRSFCRWSGNEVSLVLGLMGEDGSDWTLLLDALTPDPSLCYHAFDQPGDTQLAVTLKGPAGVYKGTADILIDFDPDTNTVLLTERFSCNVIHAFDNSSVNVDGQIYWLPGLRPSSPSGEVKGNMSLTVDKNNLGLVATAFKEIDGAYTAGGFYTIQDGNIQVTLRIPDFNDWTLEGETDQDEVKLIGVWTAGKKDSFEMRMFDPAMEKTRTQISVKTRTTNGKFSLYCTGSIADERGTHEVELKFMQT